ncbi:MAG TPA: hypothetical protein VL442_12895 [Mucilaginibacter sp.]|nr:hypothetical protein [Mucilaginibacter sp.]
MGGQLGGQLDGHLSPKKYTKFEKNAYHMVLLSDIQDLSAYAAIGQIFLGVCGLVVLYQTFKLQAHNFTLQIRVTQAQLKIQEIEIDRYRKEIMPRFILSDERKAFWLPALPQGFYYKILDFHLNDNSLVGLDLKIIENVGFELTNGDGPNPNLPSNMNSKWRFGLQFKFESIDGGKTPKKIMAQCHLIFELHFRDTRGNLYKQVLGYVPELLTPCFTNEPVLIEKGE